MTTENYIEVLLKTIDRYWLQAIQTENQRANFTNYILVIIGAIQGYIIQREFDRFCILLSLLIFMLGCFGALISAKYYERFSEQTSRVGRLMEKIKMLNPNIDLDELEVKAREKHNKKFPHLTKVRLNKLWLLFHVGLSIL